MYAFIHGCMHVCMHACMYMHIHIHTRDHWYVFVASLECSLVSCLSPFAYLYFVSPFSHPEVDSNSRGSTGKCTYHSA